MDRLAEVLLRRRRIVVPRLLAGEAVPEPRGGRPPRRIRQVKADVAAGVVALEGDLLQRGFLVSGPLHGWLVGLGPDELAGVGRRLLEGVRRQVGDHVLHVPLFRKFPLTVPSDTVELHVRRVFALIMQEPQQPCVLCGERRSVHPVNPCAHLVCRNCWDGTDYSACPVCHRRLNDHDPFLRPSRDRTAPRTPGADNRALLLTFSADAAAVSKETAESLLARQTPLSAEDRADLVVLLAENWPQSGGWLPERIAVRATRAAAVAGLLRRVEDPEALLGAHLDTATDVLRLLFALAGGDAGLDALPDRRISLPRAIRRALLSHMERMPPQRVAEDLLRRPEKWKYAAEALHPFEHHRRYPGVAAAFAALRRTPMDVDTPFGRAVIDHSMRHPETFRFDGTRLRVSTFASHAERAIVGREDPVRLLVRRPGDLIRRLAHLARMNVPHLADAALEAVPEVAPGVLLAALDQVRAVPTGKRVFFPRGGAATCWVAPEHRPPLPPERRAELEQVLGGELRRRARQLPTIRAALLDEGLADLVAPASERTASAAFVRLPRGSIQPIPGADRKVRLFLHWMEPEGVGTDLDLSLAVYDETWSFVGLCDYTRLKLGDGAALHSGDLVSAPAPLGATEYIDLNLRALRRIGGRYAVPVVFSYNDIPFEELPRGFAGLMSSPGPQWDPLAVEQRFELAGSAKVLVPFVADLWTKRLRWVDLNLGGTGHGHNVHGYSLRLGRLAQAFEYVYGLGRHVSLWELACWHAAGRSPNVTVRRRDGVVVRFERAKGEDAASFTRRVLALEEPDATGVNLPQADFAALVRGDVDLPDAASVYALYPWRLDATRLHLLDASDLLSPLAPTPVHVTI